MRTMHLPKQFPLAWFLAPNIHHMINKIKTCPFQQQLLLHISLIESCHDGSQRVHSCLLKWHCKVGNVLKRQICLNVAVNSVQCSYTASFSIYILSTRDKHQSRQCNHFVYTALLFIMLKYRLIDWLYTPANNCTKNILLATTPQ